MALKSEAFVSDDIIHDRLMATPYRPLSKRREVDFVKKLKLSYYDDVNDDLKNLYIDYYGEAFPSFRKKYEKAIGEDKEEVLREAIDNAYLYRDMFIENNVRLVFSIVNKVWYPSVDFEDLYQAGITGMMTALEKFDIRKNIKFSTYATWWIRQAVNRYIADNSNTIRIPVHMFDSITALSKAENRLTQSLGRFPSDEELALELDVSLGKLDDIKGARGRKADVSLDAFVGEEEDATFADFIPSDDPLTADVVEAKAEREMIDNIIESTNLDDRAKRILALRFGLEDGEVHTLEEIGHLFNISRERVRQIEREALNGLRRNPDIHYLDNRDDLVLKSKRKKSEKTLLDRNAKAKSFDRLRNILLEADLSDLDEEAHMILSIIYGLDSVIASEGEIAEFLGVDEADVIDKEKEALQFVFKKRK